MGLRRGLPCLQYCPEFHVHSLRSGQAPAQRAAETRRLFHSTIQALQVLSRIPRDVDVPLTVQTWTSALLVGRAFPLLSHSMAVNKIYGSVWTVWRSLKDSCIK